MNVGVIGLGKLGLPLLALLANANHKVMGFDTSHHLIDLLRKQVCPYPEPGLIDLLISGQHNIEYTSEIDILVKESDVCMIIVPTPSQINGEFENSIILNVCEEIGNSLRKTPKQFTVDIVSTVMPGSCDGKIRETLENFSGLAIGEQLGLCYNPEFIALGSVIRDMQYPDMQLLGANSPKHAEQVEILLRSISCVEVPIRRMSLIEAELVKISVNNFVTMKIAFANMLGEVAAKLGNLDIDVITDAIGLDSRIGKKYLKAGTPFGGPCFPRDTKALSALLHNHGIRNALPRTVDQANSEHRGYLRDVIATRARAKKVGVLGLSYKPNTPVFEESPGVNLLKDLEDCGLEVFGWDPLVKSDTEGLGEVKIIDSFEDFIEKSDLIVISRPIPDVERNLTAKLEGKIEVIDLWRQSL
jgi:UDPglucose 6-dehydrogenase